MYQEKIAVLIIFKSFKIWQKKATVEKLIITLISINMNKGIAWEKGMVRGKWNKNKSEQPLPIDNNLKFYVLVAVHVVGDEGIDFFIALRK